MLHEQQQGSMHMAHQCPCRCATTFDRAHQHHVVRTTFFLWQGVFYVYVFQLRFSVTGVLALFRIGGGGARDRAVQAHDGAQTLGSCCIRHESGLGTVPGTRLHAHPICPALLLSHIATHLSTDAHESFATRHFAMLLLSTNRKREA